MRQSFAFLLEKALLKAPVKLQHSKRFGRSLVASRKIKAGETILQEDPWYKSDISDQPELIERLDLDSVEELKTGEAADQKAAAIFVGQVLLKRHPAFTEHALPLEEWPELELHHSQTIWEDVLDNDALRTAFVHIGEELDLRVDEFWSKKLFSQLASKYLTNCFQKHDSPFSELFVGKSMFNHACGSNCLLWPESGDVFAEIDIAEGEQLLLNYGSENLISRDISCLRDETCICHNGADIPRNETQICQIQLLAKIRRDCLQTAGIRVQDGQDELWMRLESSPPEVQRKFFATISALFPPGMDWEQYSDLTEEKIKFAMENLGPNDFMRSDVGRMAAIRPIAMTTYLSILGVNVNEVAQKMRDEF